MTRPTTTYSRGDIVLVPFAFSDRPAFKNRPALVVSSHRFHSAPDDVIIAALTSRIRQPLLAGDYLLTDWHSCVLPRPSVVTAILRTAKGHLIVKKLGEVSAAALREIDQLLREVLAL